MARKILLADDSVTAQNMGRKILADAGYEVITVNNGSAALKKIAEARPDLIVLDVYMPGYSGLEVCQRLKENGETARIPILLTVGKLEPFKPEEAKRVRAEGFIVKPFEASELLSALTKLEDKMVPRSDSSKPGRFARAIAAVEEGRYDNTVAIDEDSGWKNRIAFPSKKKKAAEPEDDGDPAIYNPVNKDLKTVVEHRPSTPQPLKADEHVDLGALAPEGLPSNVTAEEIAALAAAAAQVKGIIQGAESPAQASSVVPVTSPEPQSAPVAEAAPVVAPAIAVAEANLQDQTPAPPESEPAPQAKEADAAAFVSQTPAAEQIQESAPAVAEPGKSEPEPASVSAAPIAAPEIVSSPAASSVPSPESAPVQEPEPVTMAAAAGFGSAPSARWTAVPVALSPEEAGIILHDEMRKAYSEFVGASAGSTSPAAESALAVAEPPAAVAEITATETIPSAAAESAVETLSAPPAPETMPEIASPVAEAPRAVVKEFETIRPAKVEPESFEPPLPEATVIPAPVEIPPTEVTQTEAPAPEAQEFSAPAAESFASVPAAPEAVSDPETPAPVFINAEIQEPQSNEFATEPQPESAPVMESAPEPESAPIAESSSNQPVVAEESSPEAIAAPQTATQIEEPAPLAEPVPGGTFEMAKKESDISATTAAAWASWRRIRESGDTKTSAPHASAPEKEASEQPAPKDEAAMAVAAGAEKAPEEATDSSSETPEIASIVDSVLADLRPKIVEEISRKLGKKK